jgi:NADH-quinone oxidoreductase subunit A
MKNKKMLIQFLILSVLILASFILSQSTRNLEKLSAYECGLEPLGNARLQIKIVYYIIGILYLLFDLEIIFLYP